MEDQNKLVAWYRNLSDREQRLVGVWFVAMIFIVIFITTVKINGAIEDRRVNIDAYESALKLIAERQDEYATAKGGGTGGGKSLDERIATNEIKLQTFLDKEATRFDLKINNFKESSAPVGGKRSKKDAGGVMEESVVIDIESADYTQFARFVDKIQRSPELLVIKRLSLQRPRRANEPQKVRVSMTISTFKKGDS